MHYEVFKIGITIVHVYRNLKTYRWNVGRVENVVKQQFVPRLDQ